jgi:Derlin-2/3
MAQPVEQWITDIPPVTRAWVIAAVGTSLLVVSPPSSLEDLTLTEQEFQVVAPLQLYFSWKAAVGKGQVSSWHSQYDRRDS